MLEGWRRVVDVRPTVRVLGPVEVWGRSGPVSLAAGRQMAFFGLLAAHVGASISVDRVIDELWGDQPPVHPRATVQTLASRLRSAVADVAGLSVASSEAGYRLEVDDPASIDAVRLEDAVTRATGAEPAAVLDAVVEAGALWRGEPYAGLDGRWVVAERERLTRLALSAEKARTAALIDLDRHEEAATVLGGLVAAHPYDEDLVERLARCRYSQSGSADALAVIAEAGSRLREDLGVEPGPALAELEVQILDHRLEVEGSAPAESGQGRLPTALGREGRFGFEGREEEIARLEATWKAASGDGPQLVEIVGEAGAGKSALAARFARSCHALGAEVVFVRWDRQVEVGYPGLLRSANVDLSASEAMGDPVLRRHQVFDSVVDGLAARAGTRRLLLVADDLQWADPASLALVGHLLDADLDLMMVATRRVPGEHSAELDGFIATRRRAGQLTRVEVPPLGLDDVAALADRGGVADGTAGEVHDRSGGNAFFVVELLSRQLDDEQAPSGVTAGIREVLRDRVLQLDDQARGLIEVAALAGERLDLDAVAEAGDCDLDDVLDAVSAAEKIGLVAADVDGRLHFGHDLVRTAIAETLDESRRLHLHHRLGRTLEKHHGPAQADQIAHHYWSARVLVPEAARRWSHLAGEAAMAAAAHEQAEAWFGRALEVADDDRGRLDALLALGRAQAGDSTWRLVWAVDGERAPFRPTFRSAYELARALDDPISSAEAALGYVGRLEAVPDLDDFAKTALRRSLDRLPVEEHRLRLQVRNVLTSGTRLRARAHQGAMAAEVGGILDDARRFGDPEVLFDAITTALWSQPDPRRGSEPVRLAQDLLELADHLDDPDRRAEALSQRARLRIEAGDLTGATDDLDERERIEGRTRRFDASGPSMSRVAIALAEARFDDAGRHLDDARAAHPAGHIVLLYQRLILGWLHGEVTAVPSGSFEISEDLPEASVIQLVAGAALLLATRGDLAEAGRALTDLADRVETIALLPEAAPFVACLAARSAAIVGPGPWVSPLADLLDDYQGIVVVQPPTAGLWGAVEGYAGIFAHLTGDLGRAETLLWTAIDRNRDLGILPFEAFAHYDLARLLADANQPDRAIDEVGRALTIAEATGMRRLTRWAGDLRQSLG